MCTAIATKLHQDAALLNDMFFVPHRHPPHRDLSQDHQRLPEAHPIRLNGLVPFECRDERPGSDSCECFVGIPDVRNIYYHGHA